MAKAKIGIGIISFAHGHVGAYAAMIKGFDDAALVGCWDDDEERGRSNAETFGIPYHPHLEDLLGRADVDCVIIASETNKHTALSLAAIDAGKDVLLQKPMALTLSDCDRITETVSRKGVWFSLAFQMRCDPQNIKMREILQSGGIGRLGMVRRRHCIGVLFNKDFYAGATRWHVSAEANKGMFFDDAIHALDWLYWTVGEKPVSVMAEIDNVLTNVAPDDTGVALFRFADGAFADIFNSSVVHAGENTTEIYGDKGVLIQNHGDGPSNAVLPPNPIGVKLWQLTKADQGWQDLGIAIPSSHGQRIHAVARAFVDAYRGGSLLCSAEEGRVSVEMCLAAYRSAEAGTRVQLPLSQA